MEPDEKTVIIPKDKIPKTYADLFKYAQISEQNKYFVYIPIQSIVYGFYSEETYKICYDNIKSITGDGIFYFEKREQLIKKREGKSPYIKINPPPKIDIEDSNEVIQKKEKINALIKDFIEFYQEENKKGKEEINNIMNNLIEKIEKEAYVNDNHRQYISSLLNEELKQELGVIPQQKSKLTSIYGNLNHDKECHHCHLKNFDELYKYQSKDNNYYVCGDCRQKFISSQTYAFYTLERTSK